MEINEFMESEAPVPGETTDRILNLAHEQLHPPMHRVILKAITVQSIASLFTFFVCPQMGLGFWDNYALMTLFMEFGDVGCMLGCGAVFASISFFLIPLILHPEETQTLRRRRWVWMMFQVGASLGALVCLGNNVVVWQLSLWFVSAVTIGLSSVELGWTLKKRLLLGQF